MCLWVQTVIVIENLLAEDLNALIDHTAIGG
jgi:hypothetical protein